MTLHRRGRYPKNPDGSDDYESLQALDLEKLHTCLKDLYKTGVCDAPVFDFTVQQPTGTRRIDARDGVVIIEGLHALNPALTEQLPDDAALCLYAGLREEYADERDARCLATRDIRLARRLVRDCLFRGHGAAFTLGLWGHVCAGEDRYIKPYKPRANLLLDTTHTYEVCLVAHRAGHDARRPGADRHPGPPVGLLAGKIRCIPGAFHCACAAKQYAAGVYWRIMPYNSRKIYICALQTAPQ